ncbi:GNAT family N-acetyltransferase [Aeromicrobium sp. CTD01-1L150]|uniref:GNAT family N-acetyltransferase n=1 Tax=Aeromicrobium sp. CTD01-1L150 TaxID=3341830 RepID=UPI0035C04E4A
MIVREATEADWEQMLQILREVVDDGATYGWPPDITDAELRHMWLGQPGWRTIVATDDAGSVLGFADYGPNRIGRGAHVANASFVVGAAARGRGVGRRLGEEVIVRAAADGFCAMQFNAVVETNTRAVALWTSLGFQIVGTVPQAFDDPEHGLVGLHVMHRFLA